MEKVVIDVSKLYEGQAKLDLLDQYVSQALQIAGSGKVVKLTGAGPVWLYLKIAHALHGKAVALVYSSPVTGDVVIFDHNPF